MGDARVFAHQAFGARAFALLDGVEHRAVLGLRHDQHVARLGPGGCAQHEAVGRGERQRLGPLELAPHHVAAGHLGQQGVEAAVVPHVAGEGVFAQAGRGQQRVDAADAVARLGQQRAG